MGDFVYCCFRKIFLVFFLLLNLVLYFLPATALAFKCKDATGLTINSASGGGYGVFNVTATLQPSVAVGQNLVVDLSQSIQCLDEDPANYTDWVALQSGSAYGGVLTHFTGTLSYSGTSFPFPLTSSTGAQANTSPTYVAWPVQLYLTPVTAAGGVVVTQGEKIAVLNMHKYSTDPQTGLQNGTIDNFVWNIFAGNSVVVPTGGCDVSARDVTVSLPDYPGSAAVPLTVHCAQSQRLGYYLSGPVSASDATLFTNAAATSPAQGVGVRISDSHGPLAAGSTVSLGAVSTAPVNLGLSAAYGLTGGQVTAGNVQAVIGVTFVYQ
ncbi:fimbrial protein [Pantoea ananatis]|uniref:fimbrial protein n=1 Tax=Pantoea ananas TaxID=553 RepID=UPI0024AE4355|nr:fimbrial protein [Pantoea ananatis]MDI6539114.1 fimbrial protein [Pantoea ananatis]